MVSCTLLYLLGVCLYGGLETVKKCVLMDYTMCVGGGGWRKGGDGGGGSVLCCL